MAEWAFDASYDFDNAWAAAADWRYDFEARHRKPDVFIRTFPLPKPSDNMPILLSRR